MERPSPRPPRHVAIVMDGNGRWANRRFMPRFVGHKQGVDALVRTVKACADRGIEFLTVFAFSSENWKRPEEEVSGLMGLVLVAVSKYLGKLEREGVRIRIVGDRQAVSPQVRAAWDETERRTINNTRITLSVAFTLVSLLRRRDRSYESFPATAAPLGILAADPATDERIDLDNGELYVFSDGLTEYRYVSGERLGVEGLIQLIESLAAAPLEARERGDRGRIGAASFQTPRTTIRTFLDLLAVLESNPAVPLSSLLDGMEIAPDTDTSTPAAAADDDDDLASFTL